MFMESAEQRTTNLHAKVSESLTRSGHPATPQSVNPHDESSLGSVKRDVQHLTGSFIEERFKPSNSVNDRNTKGKIATLIGKIRRMGRAA